MWTYQDPQHKLNLYLFRNKQGGDVRCIKGKVRGRAQQQNRLYNKGFHFSYPRNILTHFENFSSVPLLQRQHVKIKLGEMILQRIQVQPPAITGSGVTRHDPSCHVERTDSINHLRSLLTVNHSHPSWPPTNLFCKARVIQQAISSEKAEEQPYLHV